MVHHRNGNSINLLKGGKLVRNFAILATLLLILVMIMGCGEDKTTEPEPAVDEFEVVRAAVDSYTGGTAAPTILAGDVYANLNDGDDTNDPYILSVRSATHYAIGHIPGAENIPWREIAESANLATLPTDQQIVVYCYTGHTGGVATTCLQAMGYDAVNLKFGIMSWTRDADARATQPFSEENDAHNYDVETTINTLPATNDFPVLDNTTSEDVAEIVRAAADAYAGGTNPPTMAAADLYANLNDGDDTNDPIILSVRSAEHYAIGHIPGAINIPWREIADADNLPMLPTDQQIVVYCYTGHTGAVATTALNLMGYDAVNLKWGIMSWTQDEAVRVASPFDDETDSHDYDIETGG
jgi:rhodanese-related sulfurtransferase